MILDTNALSALADGDQKLHKVILKVQQLMLPVIVLGEYRYGLKRSRERIAREEWLIGLESCSLVLPITPETAQRYASIREELRLKGFPIPENDLWIAALTREHDIPIVTRDAHFDYVTGLKRIVW